MNNKWTEIVFFCYTLLKYFLDTDAYISFHYLESNLKSS